MNRPSGCVRPTVAMPMIGNVYANPAGTPGPSCRAKRQEALPDDIFCDTGRSPASAITTFIQCGHVEEVFMWLTNWLNLEHVCMPPVRAPRRLRPSPRALGAFRCGPGFFRRLTHERFLFESRSFIVELLVNCGNVARVIFGVAVRHNESDHEGKIEMGENHSYSAPALILK